MKLEDINNYTNLVQEIYSQHLVIENLENLYNFLNYYNKDWDDAKLKKAVLFLIERILSDDTHYFKSIENEDGIEFSKKNNNIADGLEFINKYWDTFLNNYKESNPFMYLTLNDGERINICPYFYWTEAWKNELCQLSKLGYQNGMSYDNNCQFNTDYQYQMPAHRFIPDNDCGCEE